MRRRIELLARLRAQRFDVLIIGGGIVGAGIARDAAMRGLKVALVEQGDFASGTSSKTSKLIHGGLRYLEQGQLGLVRESLRERQILRTIAPSYVHPRALLLPLYVGGSRPAWKVNIGLWLYDLLAAGRNLRPHQMLSAKRALALEPNLSVDGLMAAALYTDCHMDDARICLANVLQAESFGATCVNYAQVHGLLSVQGRVSGAVVEDRLRQHTFEVQAEVVVNATGPWTDRLRRLSQRDAPQRISPTKGIHVILPRLAREALFVESARNRRMIFVLPWGSDYTLLGTTEGLVDRPLESLRANGDEVGYLLDEVNRVLVGRHVTADDVLATFAGARPLLTYAGSSSAASREHRIEEDRWGLLSVMGGKYTTYRLMAQQVVDWLVRRLRRRVDRCLTDQISLVEEIHPVSLEQWRHLTSRVDPDVLARCLARYGAGTFRLLRVLERDPALLQSICPHHEHIMGELLYSVEHEQACTITDVLARRTRIAWSSCQGLDVLSSLGEVLQQHGGYSRATVEWQIDEYQAFLAQGLAFRTSRPGEQLWTAQAMQERA